MTNLEAAKNAALGALSGIAFCIFAVGLYVCGSEVLKLAGRAMGCTP